ncbi:ectoine/hydroxyectoine ABC transporter substrate-binding protein EhuB [Saccharomonospora sp. NPDC046836]|uniref:ectoine/hydroxyectoine ABC transporter substrate-binding protein EhuB n=1 Tax=Saccharomonospora sp. NPDC046836 TaxID=3156921 RepID=UPI0033DB4B0D
MPASQSRREIFRLLFGATLASAGLPLISSCSAGPQTGGSDVLGRARQTGSIRAGFDNQAPWGFVDDNNAVTGGVVELTRKGLTDLGIPAMEGIVTPFESLIPGLQARRFDLITGGMGIVTKRCDQILFTDPFILARESFVMKKDARYKVSTYEDVAENPDMKLAVDPTGIERTYATALGVKEDQLVLAGGLAEMIAAVKGGRADALSVSSTSINTILSNPQNGDLIASEGITPVIDGKPQLGGVGIGFRKEDRPLRDAFNEQIKKYMQNGETARIMGPFGFSPSDIEAAAGHTSSELCATQS